MKKKIPTKSTKYESAGPSQCHDHKNYVPEIKQGAPVKLNQELLELITRLDFDLKFIELDDKFKDEDDKDKICDFLDKVGELITGIKATHKISD